ncbi:MAG: hypothetical protein RL653_2262 [Pseudomonadota bacterium]|jgi:hypothetical protein
METSPALPWALALLLVLGAGTLTFSRLGEHLLRAGIGSPVVVAAAGPLAPEELKPPRERHRPERARRPVQRSTRPSSYDW